MLVIVRSVIFNVLFYLNLAAYLIVAMPTLLLPYRYLLAVARAWAYVQEAIAHAPGFGAGHGPLDHAWSLRGRL